MSRIGRNSSFVAILFVLLLVSCSPALTIDNEEVPAPTLVMIPTEIPTEAPTEIPHLAASLEQPLN